FNAKLLASVERLKKALKRQWSLDFFVRSLYLVLPAMGLFSFGFWYSQTDLVLMPGALATAVVLTVMVTVAQAYICQNIDAILWSPSSISLGQDTPPSSNTHVEPVNLRGAIELVNVSFSYADASELVVKNYSAIFSAEKFYIIYGPSGVGKTTMLRLLMGDLSPIMGEVVIDGQDVRSLNQESLRKRFGVVFEAAHLFAGSVYDNILCGREQQKGNLKKLLLSHAIFDHLIDLPMGVETYIFSQGKNLSRLEYAIVLLARALVHEPIFLFMDDFLTGLGPKQQASILGYLSSLKITRILTANHELAKVHCDGIIEIGQHAITELGSSAL
ncbi:MAG TPA: ATP-binding cassette domain-containing protein, partial [Myxococcota bacterium]|nr:ATP-binding cassette domain-containing protein [Myxococcota bacterium]